MNLRPLGVLRSSQDRGILPCGDIAALVYLWNPFTILSCVGLSTSPIENLAVIVSLYGAVTRRVPLAAFGLIMATHLSLYSAPLVFPVCIISIPFSFLMYLKVFQGSQILIALMFPSVDLSVGIWFRCPSYKKVPSDKTWRG
jgi:hypothetical protein